MRIGELARRSGASVRSLRHYEQHGLLVSTRSDRGQRHYDEAAVERVLFIRRLLGAGLGVRIIAGLMPCFDRPSVDGSDEAFRTMSREHERLTACIDRLVDARAALDELIAGNVARRAAMTDRDRRPGDRPRV